MTPGGITALASKVQQQTSWKPAAALLLEIAEAVRQDTRLSLTAKLLAVRLASGTVLLPEAQRQLKLLI